MADPNGDPSFINATFNSFMKHSVRFVDGTSERIGRIAAAMTMSSSSKSAAGGAPLFSMSPARFRSVNSLRLQDPKEYGRLLDVARKYDEGAYSVVEATAALYGGGAPP